MAASGVAGELPGWLGRPSVRAVGAVLVLVGGWYLSRLLVRVFGRRIARRFQRPSITRAVLRGARVAIVLVALLVAAVVLGLPITSLALSVTVFSAVLGVVLAPLIGSVVNGLFVLADQPYEIGDMIELADRGQRGYVEDITIRYTKIFTLENTFLVIPNAQMRERDVVNFSAEDERTRLGLGLLVTYEGDLDEARRIMEAAARDVEEVIASGPDIRIGSARYSAEPTCYVGEYADHGVQLDLRYWVRNPYYLPRVRSKVNERVWAALDDADVTIAYPHSHLVFDETSGTARVALSEDGADGRRATDRRPDHGRAARPPPESQEADERRAGGGVDGRPDDDPGPDGASRPDRERDGGS